MQRWLADDPERFDGARSACFVAMWLAREALLGRCGTSGVGLFSAGARNIRGRPPVAGACDWYACC